MEALLSLFGLLVFGHALADYPLQNDYMAVYKNHQKSPEHGPPHVWFHLLTAHSIIHGGFVGVITGNVWLGLLEFVLHWYLDFSKSAGHTTLDQDQALHWLCKLLYAGLIGGGVVAAWPWWWTV